MDFKPTKKGFLRGEFEDRFGAVCSVQESSMVGEDCIWLGVEADFDGREVRNGRMHLTQQQALELMPILRHFARTGRLGVDEKDRFHVGRWVTGVSEDTQGIEGRVISRDDVATVIQDQARPGATGQWVGVNEVVELHWEPIDVPDHIPTRYERISADDDEG